MPLLTSLSRDQIPSDLHDLWDQCNALVERIVSPLQVDCPSRRWQVRITTVVSPAEKAEISCHVFTKRSTS
jgi:hypothetical protein